MSLLLFLWAKLIFLPSEITERLVADLIIERFILPVFFLWI